MEREAFFSGYCRQLDGARTVAVEAEGNALTEVDCLYESCPYAPACPIAQSVRAFLEKAE
ncbi:MAG: ubiquinone biosynthesis protein UbiE [Oscillospiraceae bacterium]|nr:ubiquinone biosynthesis protein UbiE [Oscillospiraceae bacterium]